MDNPLQPSFIPKKPLGGPSVRSGGAAFGMFFVLVATLIFVASIFAAGGAFVFKGFLQSSIASKADTLQKAEAAFDPSTIQDLVRLDSRINNAESLLQKHVTALSIFNFFSQQTLQNVQFTGFTYELQENGVAQVSLTGVADGFATVALQSDQLGASKTLKNVVFSSIVVNATGRVGFNVKADLDPSLLSYAKNLNAAPTSAPSPMPAGTSSPQQIQNTTGNPGLPVLP